MKIFLLGAAVGLVVGMAITVMYFALATLFTANSKFFAARADRQRTVLKDPEITSPTVKEKAQGVGA